jgi:FHS family L-fucose permease-like MFS transporter
MKRNYLIVILILLTFFVISFLTNILGALNPNVSASYTLTETMAGFLPFAFFIAYGIMSIPSGILVEKWGEKRMMILAFVFAFSGALLFAICTTIQCLCGVTVYDRRGYGRFAGGDKSAAESFRRRRAFCF